MKILLAILVLAFLGLYYVLRVMRKVAAFFTEPEEKPEKKKRDKRPTLHTDTAVKKKKVISRDKGEYVDYEEIK